ncbi:hypothetical protein AB0M42_07825 [Streptomyces sp. NPDC051784]|uniref:hypothetical protein n=1 Tax=Streptomyces sp. NPDC051784 TaxID=3155805 RepID=UPI0034334DC5
MRETSVARFYDAMADDYHPIYSDWDTGIRRQDFQLMRILSRMPCPVSASNCESSSWPRTLRGGRWW